MACCKMRNRYDSTLSSAHCGDDRGHEMIVLSYGHPHIHIQILYYVMVKEARLTDERDCQKNW